MRFKKSNTVKLVTYIFAFMIFANSTAAAQSATQWAFEETFDGDPNAPSQALLPKNFDYVVTHRRDSGGIMVDYAYDTFLADHSDTCEGPIPLSNSTQDTNNLHSVSTSHLSNAKNPDESFFVCKNHMMSSMGHVSGYSVSAFWPRQEFNFSDGGILEFDTNINEDHSRSWWEVLIVPRDNMRVGAAIEWLPIDETYPRNSIALRFSEQSAREIIVSGDTSKLSDAVVHEKSCKWGEPWCVGEDPALTDRRIRRTHRIEIQNNKIIWSIQKEDGSMHPFEVVVPEGLKIDQGIVIFKQHAYTPKKDGNLQRYTTHWDNIKFDGPQVGFYEAYEADDVVRLQNNGNRPIGDTYTVNVNLPEVGDNTKIFGQVDSPKQGQVLLSINDSDYFSVYPNVDADEQCEVGGWQTFVQNIDKNLLKIGDNKLTWKVGPRPSCAEDSWRWDGYAIKALEIQFDSNGSSNGDTGNQGGQGGTDTTGTGSTDGDNTTPPVEETPLFLGTYYKNNQPMFTQYTDEINYDWKKGSPDSAVLGNDQYSVIWVGEKVPFEAGIYRFIVGGDDGVKLLIDGTEIINGWRNQSFTTYYGDRYIAQGEHKVELHYYENKGRSRVSLDWDLIQTIGQMCTQ